jgi:hypothetical protein
MITLSSDSLRRAADLTEQIEHMQEELNQILAGQLSTASTSDTGPRYHSTTTYRSNKVGDGRRNRRWTPEALEAISQGQRRRWARYHKEKRVAAKSAIAASQPAPQDQEPSQRSQEIPQSEASQPEAPQPEVQAAPQQQPQEAAPVQQQPAPKQEHQSVQNHSKHRPRKAA